MIVKELAFIGRLDLELIAQSLMLDQNLHFYNGFVPNIVYIKLCLDNI